jgi:tetratricopeptide (TPR) repeat protein
LLVAGLPSIGQAAVDYAEPLEVPPGGPPGPEEWADASVAERLEQAARRWRDRGYSNLPVLAWAALKVAERQQSKELAERARRWAPQSPAVQLQASRVTRDLRPLFRGLFLLSKSFPAVAWLVALGLGAVGMSCLLGMAVVAVLSLIRALPGLGHALAHIWAKRPTAAWPGALLLGCVLAALPLLGLGPALVVAVACSVAMAYLPFREGVAVMVLVSLSGLSLGPPLERWAAIAVVPEPGSALLAAWRIERAQPLPGDLSLLEKRVESGVATPPEILGLATAYKREASFEEAERVLASLSKSIDSGYRARMHSLIGTLRLARGNVRESIDAFTEARQADETGAIVFNLSQAHGRAIRLEDQRRLFTLAKKLDPTTVSVATAYDGTNVHRYLVEDLVPVGAYLTEASRISPAAQRLASEIRARTLGRSVPPWGWLVMPFLGVVGLLSRVRGARRCPRCLRGMCERCLPTAVPGRNCLRCRRLAVVDEAVDPRVLKRERARDRFRQRLITTGITLLGVGVPGSADLLAGRMVLGGVILMVALAGPAFFVAASILPAPSDVGSLASGLSLTLTLILLVAAYGAGGLRALAHWSRSEEIE